MGTSGISLPMRRIRSEWPLALSVTSDCATSHLLKWGLLPQNEVGMGDGKKERMGWPKEVGSKVTRW